MKPKIDIRNLAKICTAETMRRNQYDGDLSQRTFLDSLIEEERAEIFGNTLGDSPEYALEEVRETMRFMIQFKHGEILTIGHIGKHLNSVCDILGIDAASLPEEKAIRLADSALMLAKGTAEMGMLPVPNSEKFNVQSFTEELVNIVEVAICNEELPEENRLVLEYMLWDHISRFIGTVERSIKSGQTPPVDPQ